MAKTFGLRFKELYWTTTRAVGLESLHGINLRGKAKNFRNGLHAARERRKFHFPPAVRMALPDIYRCDRRQLGLFNLLWQDYFRDYGRPADPVRVIQFMNLLQSVQYLQTGDFIELGVQRGYTARIIYQLMPKTNCTLYLLDTYQKSFDAADVAEEASRFGWATKQDFPETSPEGVMRLVTEGWPTERVKTLAGWFPSTFAGLEDKKWRFVHIDFDLYAPIKAALDLLWPHTVPGGVVMIHDYGCSGFPGVKKAVDDFAKDIALRPIVLADSMGSACFIKPGHSSLG